MAIIKCKMCGGDLEILEDSSVCECEYCGTRQTVPSADSEKKLTLFNRAGRLLRSCEFDKAAGVFETIVADFPEEAEAYWGLVLCKYGIEYVDDPATGKKIPTCHRSSFDSVEDDPNYEQACENADPVAHRLYREETRQIETLRKRILEVSGKEEPYDVFISYKELDEGGERTPDSVIAQDIYRTLTKEGYRVFFSRISLEGKLGVEYEPYIFAALNSAKVMIVVGTDYDYFNAVWVKNEWSRFLKLIAAGQPKTIIPVYKDMDPYDMPKELRALAAQNMGKIGAMQDLLHGVEKLLGKDKAPLKQEPQPVVQQVVSGGPTVEALIQRGAMALEDNDWDAAKGYFDRILDSDVRNASAYLGLYMARKHITTIDALRKTVIAMDSDPASENGVYERAKRFAAGDLAEKLNDWETERAEAKRRKEEKERFRQEEERKRQEEERKRQEEEHRRLDVEVEKVLAALRNTNDKNAMLEMQASLKAERGKLISIRQLSESFKENLTERNIAKEKIEDLKRQVIQLEKERDDLGFFGGKQKAQIDSRIETHHEQIRLLEKKASDADKKLGGYQSEQDLVRDMAKIGKNIEELINSIEKQKPFTASEYSYEKAIQIINSSPYVREKVRKVFHQADFLDRNPGDTITYGQYSTEGVLKKPIEWLVLARKNNKLLLISKFALDCIPFNEKYKPVNWETCGIRVWLNETFLNSAFSRFEQEIIPTVEVNTDGKTTRDRVFLLSAEEAASYFSGKDARKCMPTSFALSHADQSDENRKVNTNSAAWWLRSTSGYSCNAAFVENTGAIGNYGLYIYRKIAVRPALWIDLGA